MSSAAWEVIPIPPARKVVIVPTLSEIPVAVSSAVLELNVKPVFDFGPKSPETAVANSGKQEISVASLATVIVVGIPAADPNSHPVPAELMRGY